MAAEGADSLIIIDERAADDSSRINSVKVYRHIRSAEVQTNTSKLIGRQFCVH